MASLLKNGELPNLKEGADFENRIRKHTMMNEQVVKFYQGFCCDAHPCFVEKKRFLNVDFCSGMVQKAQGIPSARLTCRSPAAGPISA